MPHNFKMMEKLLIKNIRKGCVNSFEKIFHIYYNRLFAYSNRLINNPEKAKEIVNDSFLRLWQSRDKIKNDVDSIKPYLFQITHNLSINFLKKDYNRINRIEIQDVVDDFNYELMLLEYSDLEQALNTAINKLPEARREIFLMSRKDELKYTEIAKRLGISQKTVETQISRSLSFLRLQLKSFLPNFSK